MIFCFAGGESRCLLLLGLPTYCSPAESQFKEITISWSSVIMTLLQSVSPPPVRLKSLSLGYTSLRDFVACRYRRTRLPANQWEFAGLSVNWESIFIMQTMSGLVCFAMYNRDPNRLLYSVPSTDCSFPVILVT